MGVDTPRNVYETARDMRARIGRRATGEFAEKDLLLGLYMGIASLPLDPFYDRAWAAMEQAISELEQR